MLRRSISQVRAGMTLYAAVHHPRTGLCLLKPGFVLDAPTVTRLRSLDVREVCIRHDDLDTDTHPAPDTVAMAQQGVLAETVSRLFGAIQDDALGTLSFRPYRHALRDVIAVLADHPDVGADLPMLAGKPDNDLRHAVEVCTLSLLLGIHLQEYLVAQRPRLEPAHARNLVSLGLGAILHDVGLDAYDPTLRAAFGASVEVEDDRWREHVMIGHHRLTSRIAPSAAGIVLHHHQHFDGSGFPTHVDDCGDEHGLRGEEIHVYARIVCVANHFDRLRFDDAGVPQPRVRVLHRMLAGPLMTRFDPVVLAALANVVPAYPPGTSVTLNTGEQGVVTAWHPESPCQPTVHVVDRTGPVSYDLRRRSDLLIVEQDGHDVAQDNFRLIAPPTPALLSSVAD